MKTIKYRAIYDYGSGIERYDILSVKNEKLFSEFLDLSYFTSGEAKSVFYDSEKELISCTIENLERDIEKYRNLIDKEDFSQYSYSQLKMYIELTAERVNKMKEILSRYEKRE